MPKTMTREELEAQAAQLNAQLDQIRAEEQRAAEAAAQRRAEAEAEADRQFIATTTAASLNADVDKAAQALDQALGEDPLILAIGDFFTSLRRRGNLKQELNNARMRIGQEPVTYQFERTEIHPDELLDMLQKAASRIAADRVRAELVNLEAKRTAAGEAAAQQG